MNYGGDINMSEQDREFENWYISEYCKGLSEISINEVMSKNSLGVYSSFHVNGAYSGWQAETAEANKRIEALEGEVAELKANSERLRKAAEKLVAVMVDALPRFDIIEQGRALDQLMKVMYDTPAESLQAHDDELIEKCANVATDACLVPPDGGTPMSYEVELCDAIAESIRALKEVK